MSRWNPFRARKPEPVLPEDETPSERNARLTRELQQAQSPEDLPGFRDNYLAPQTKPYSRDQWESDEVRQARLDAYVKEYRAEHGTDPPLNPRDDELWWLPPLPTIKSDGKTWDERHPAEQAAIVQVVKRDMEEIEREAKDPCAAFYNAYIRCAEALQNGPRGGMTLNNECEAQKDAYRDCRRRMKKLMELEKEQQKKPERYAPPQSNK